MCLLEIQVEGRYYIEVAATLLMSSARAYVLCGMTNITVPAD